MRSLDTVDCNPLGCCLSGSEGAIAANGAVEVEETEALPGQAPVRTVVDVEIEVEVEGALEVVDANVEDNDDVSDGNGNDDEDDDDDDNRAVGKMTSGMTRETMVLLFITVSNLSFLFLL